MSDLKSVNGKAVVVGGGVIGGKAVGGKANGGKAARGQKSSIEITTVHRCRIDYGFNREDNFRETKSTYEKVSDRAARYARALGVEMSYSRGGPCWNAYLIFEGANRNAVAMAASMTLTYIKRFKGYEIY